MERPASSTVAYYLPNKMVRIVLLAMEEVVGRTGVNAVLNVAHLGHLVNAYPPNNFDRQVSFADLGALMRSIDVMYGPLGGRTLALRSGRACFRYGLKEFGPEQGLADLTYRLLPLPMKLKAGAEAFCDVFNRLSDQLVRLTELDEHFLWENVRCPLCWGRQTDGPCCHLHVGLVQEALYWVSGGKHFDVTETTCAGRGDHTCTFVVAKQPLD